MATNSIKGLTVEIGGDTTSLGKALESINSKSKMLSSELGAINKLLKVDPGNYEALAQKQKILADAVENTRKKLDTLKEAEAQVQAQFERGEVSEEQVSRLRIEITNTTAKLKTYEKAAQETADAMEQAGESAKGAADSIEDLGASSGELSSLTDKVADQKRELDSLKDSYIQAATAKGRDSDEAKTLANQIESLSTELQNNEQQLKAAERAADGYDKTMEDVGGTLNSIANTGFAAVTGACTAVIGGLVAAAESTREYREAMGKLNTAFEESGFSAEAANTAYMELVGVLGESDQAVEAANHLAKLTDNEKDLATWTGDILPGVFATFGDSLPIEGLTEAANETAKVGQVTGPLADAINWATTESSAWEAALSGNNAALAAFQTATAEGAGAEDAFNEALAACSTEQERQALITQTLSSLYGEASTAYKETNADVIAANEANAAWTASLAEVGATVEPLITDVKTMGAELLSNIVPAIETLLANLPTVAVAVAGITAALVSYKVAALAATAAEKGMTLAQYAATAAQTALNVAMSANPIGIIILAITALVAAFVTLWNNCESFREFWINLWEKIKSAVSAAVNFFKEIPQKIYNAIKGAIDKVTTWGSNLVTKAKTAASNFLNGVASTLKNIPSKVASAISGALQSVASWGSNMVSKAKTAMKNLISGVTSTLKSLPSKILSIGSDLVSGLWNGITNKLSWLKSKISGFASSVLSSIKSFFGVNSPSKETAWIGDMLDQGLAKGITDSAKDPVNAMQRVSSGVLDATGTVDGLSLERSIQTASATSAAQASTSSGIAAKLDKILTAIEKGQVLMLDGDALVGGTVDRYDTAMGQRRLLAARGAV